MAIANNFDTISVCSEQSKNEDKIEIHSSDEEDQFYVEEGDQRISFTKLYNIENNSMTNGTEKCTYRKGQWKDSTSETSDSAARKLTYDENNRLKEPPTKRQRTMLTTTRGKFSKSVFSFEILSSCQRLNARNRSHKTKYSSWKDNTTSHVLNICNKDMSCVKKCILDLKHCLRYPPRKFDNFEPVKLVYNELVEYAYKYFYDISLAMVYISSSSNCSRQATRRGDGSYRWKQLSDLYPHIEGSIPVPSNQIQVAEENENTNESQGRQSSRIKNRKFDPVVHNDFFYYEHQLIRKRPQQNMGERSRHNYSKSEAATFYKTLNNSEKIKWYDCYHKQQEYFRKYLNSKRPTLQSSLFDFDLFEIKYPDRNETFIEVQADRCCYCGLEWSGYSCEDRITHVRRHTSPFTMQLS